MQGLLETRRVHMLVKGQVQQWAELRPAQGRKSQEQECSKELELDWMGPGRGRTQV